MKVHITNVYGVTPDNSLVKLQRQIAQNGRRLNFLEMGIYRYRTDTDTSEELAKRIAGIIASVEFGDVVILQLPTGNGLNYEARLINILKAYGASVVLLIEDYLNYDNLMRLSSADIAYAKNHLIKKDCLGKGFKNDYIYVADSIENRTDIECQSSLLNIIKPFYAQELDEKQSYEDDMIHVCFGLHDKTGVYSLEVATVMQSIIEYTDARICFHIFIDETVSDDNKRRLRKVGSDAGDLVKFHLIDVNEVASSNEYIKNFSIGTMFRLLIPNTLATVDKVIYLDADLFFTRDIKELWNIDISDYTLAAVPDLGMRLRSSSTQIIDEELVDRESYFNAGVLVMNLDKMRKLGDLAKLAIEVLEKYPGAKFPDQDAFNILFKDETLLLEQEWNTFVLHATMFNYSVGNRIYHYAGSRYINYEDLRPWDEAYTKMKLSLSWPNDRTLHNYVTAYNMLKGKFENIQKIVPLIIEGRKKIFIGERKSSMNTIINTFGLQKEDYFVDCKNPPENATIKEMEDVAKEKKGSFVIFYMPGALDGKVRQQLTDMGLEEKVDYYPLPCLVFANQGGYLL